MLNKLKVLFVNRLSLSVLTLLALSLLIWYIGPLLRIGDAAPLLTPESRIIGILALSLATALIQFWHLSRARSKNRALLEAIAPDSLRAKGTTKSIEQSELEDKLQDAISTLRDRKFSTKGASSYVYQLPWYLIIGPPGAGKTTLLSNSGLNFPLEQSHGKKSIKGVGGTRNCDWWFTDQAVLLDTAGRYTTQENATADDSEGWQNFLEMLAKSRERCPINGLLIAISVQDLLDNNESALAETSHAVRTRIDEIQSSFSITPPLYVIFTKMDLLAGFDEYYSDLDSEYRKQVWGYTLSPEGSADTKETVTQALSDLQNTLHKQTLGKMQRELSRDKRASIYGFPRQFDSVQGNLIRFIDRLCVDSRLQSKPYLRGVYFSSATQTGNAFDQVVQGLEAQFNLQSNRPQTAAGRGRSYFINHLLTKVVFEESGLAGTSGVLKETVRKRRLIGAIALSVSTIALLSVLGFSWKHNLKAAELVQDSVNELSPKLTSLAADNMSFALTSNLLDEVKALDRIDDAGYFGTLNNVSPLNQRGEVEQHVQSKYQQLLVEALLSRFLVRLEQQMHSSADDEVLFDTLKIYLMLGVARHYKGEQVRAWFERDIRDNMPALTDLQRDSLELHSNALFQSIAPRLPRALDQSLIAHYQQRIKVLTPEQRAWHKIKRDSHKLATSYQPLSAIAGEDVLRTFVYTSERPANRAIEKLYTLEGYRWLEVHLATSGLSLLDSQWVLGESELSTDTANREAVMSSVMNNYLESYKNAWQSLLDSLQLRKAGDFDSLVQLNILLSDEESSLKKLLQTTATQTLLKPALSTLVETVAVAETTATTQAATSFGFVNNSAEQGNLVLKHFSPLHKFVASDEAGNSGLATQLAKLADLNLLLIPIARDNGINTALKNELGVKLTTLELTADNLPSTARQAIKALGSNVADIASTGECASINSAWQANVYPYYQRAIRGRYPAYRKASTEIAISDFSAFFGPGGIVDRFYQQYLSGRIQKSAGRWRWRSEPCGSEEILLQLARAEEIRFAYFSNGSTDPNFSFNINKSALNLSSDVSSFQFVVNDQIFSYSHSRGAGSNTQFNWPSDGTNTGASLAVQPQTPGTIASFARSGPWSLYRLIDMANSRRGQANSLNLEYTIGGHKLNLQLTTSSFNPLDTRALRSFRAPEAL